MPGRITVAGTAVVVEFSFVAPGVNGSDGVRVAFREVFANARGARFGKVAVRGVLLGDCREGCVPYYGRGGVLVAIRVG